MRRGHFMQDCMAAVGILYFSQILTFPAAKELRSHGNMGIPALGVNSHKSSDDWWVKNMTDNCGPVCVSSKNLRGKVEHGIQYKMTLRAQQPVLDVTCKSFFYKPRDIT